MVMSLAREFDRAAGMPRRRHAQGRRQAATGKIQRFKRRASNPG
jgi:hypothetical protein